MPRAQLTSYEEAALHELLAWKRPPITRRGKAGDKLDSVIENLARRIPAGRIEWMVEKTLPAAAHVTQLATSEALVKRAYARAGFPIRGVVEIRGLDLLTADSVAGDKRLKEGAFAAVEGGGLGFLGGPAVFADVVAVTLLSIRAVQSRALIYGFDPREEAEVVFALQLLDEASRLGPNGKRIARAATSGMGRKFASRKAVKAALDKLLARLPAQVLARLAVMKSESVVSVLGAVTGVSFNGWYLQAVTASARMAYRERFLGRRFGDEILKAYGL